MLSFSSAHVLLKSYSVKSVVQESKSDTEKQLSTPQGKILEAPTFYPSEEEFNDPLEYIDKIRPEAEKFGLCRIVPPSNFRVRCAFIVNSTEKQVNLIKNKLKTIIQKLVHLNILNCWKTYLLKFRIFFKFNIKIILLKLI